jgi:hypothetical protein
MMQLRALQIVGVKIWYCSRLSFRHDAYYVFEKRKLGARCPLIHLSEVSCSSGCRSVTKRAAPFSISSSLGQLYGCTDSRFFDQGTLEAARDVI